MQLRRSWIHPQEVLQQRLSAAARRLEVQHVVRVFYHRPVAVAGLVNDVKQHRFRPPDCSWQKPHD